MRVEQVFITPTIKAETYGAEIDVSDLISIDGISKIKKSIDSTDYSVGVFRFADLKLKGQNGTGVFNENDSRSIFPSTRNLAKVRIVVSEIDSETGAVSNTLQFKGLINEEATRVNITNDEIFMLVLSSDSVLRTTQIPAGLVVNDSDVKEAMIQILNQSSITAVLNIDPGNINPDLNFNIDLGDEFNDKKVNEMLDLLLLASNSSLIIDDSDNVIVASRAANSTTPLYLKGRGSQDGEANILSISEYNNGRQRQFNSVILNGSRIIQDDNHILEYGLKQEKFDFDFITSDQTLDDIGQRFVDEFKFPKIELKLIIPGPIADGAKLLDPVSVSDPWLKKRKREISYTEPGGATLGFAVAGNAILGDPSPPIERLILDEFFPILGGTVLGDTESRLPVIQGSVQIDKNVKFKIISIEENAKNFTATLKLRQAGISSNDGQF